MALLTLISRTSKNIIEELKIAKYCSVLQATSVPTRVTGFKNCSDLVGTDDIEYTVQYIPEHVLDFAYCDHFTSTGLTTRWGQVL